MNLKESLVNFLYDKNYFINIYDDYIHVFNFQELISLSDKKIILSLEKFKVEITGSNIIIKKMSKNEILIKDLINKVGFLYE